MSVTDHTSCGAARNANKIGAFAPDSLWWIEVAGSQEGPLKWRVVKELASAGALRPTDYVSSCDRPLWRPAREFHELVFPRVDLEEKGEHEVVIHEQTFNLKATDDLREVKNVWAVFGVAGWLCLALIWVAMTLADWPGMWDGIRIAQIQVSGALFLAASATQILPRFWRMSGINPTRLMQMLRGIVAAVVFVGLSLSVALVLNARDVVKIAFGWDELRGGEVIQASRGMIEIRGPLSAGIANRFRHQLLRQPKTTTALLNSEGGWIREGQKIGQLISVLGLNTHSSLECSSACADAFVHGHRRTLSPGAVLGFHSASGEGTDPVYIEFANDLLAQRLFELGVSSRFIEQAVSTPSGEIWYPSLDQLFAEGIVHEIVHE